MIIQCHIYEHWNLQQTNLPQMSLRPKYLLKQPLPIEANQLMRFAVASSQPLQQTRNNP